MWVTSKQIVGAVANCAVRQSPYAGGPSDLTLVLQVFERSIREDFDRAGMRGFEDWRALEDYFAPKLRAIPEYMGWNERKNGNAAPFQFVSSFDGPRDPNDDFIDLDALERNVSMSIWREEQRER